MVRSCATSCLVTFPSITEPRPPSRASCSTSGLGSLNSSAGESMLLWCAGDWSGAGSGGCALTWFRAQSMASGAQLPGSVRYACSRDGNRCRLAGAITKGETGDRQPADTGSHDLRTTNRKHVDSLPGRAQQSEVAPVRKWRRVQRTGGVVVAAGFKNRSESPYSLLVGRLIGHCREANVAVARLSSISLAVQCRYGIGSPSRY